LEGFTGNPSLSQRSRRRSFGGCVQPFQYNYDVFQRLRLLQILSLAMIDKPPSYNTQGIEASLGGSGSAPGTWVGESNPLAARDLAEIGRDYQAQRESECFAMNLDLFTGTLPLLVYARCAQGQHQENRAFGFVGILCAIFCFPVGFLCLL
jgi:hypothetical protein